MATLAIEQIEKQAAKIKSGKDRKIKPGQPLTLGHNHSMGDGVRQGDLYIAICEATAIPADFTKRESRQLVPGETQGAKHCLDSLNGVEVYFPPKWGEADNIESLQGPFILCLSADAVITHPVHGHVTIKQGLAAECWYQREYDAELRRERRNAD